MPKSVLTILLLISVARISFGQQDPQFSQYYFNQQYYNPAEVNSENAPTIQAIYRSQYVGYASNFDNGGTLNSQLVSLQMPVSKLKGGIGIVILNDQAGLQKNQQLRFSYAKNLKVSTGTLSLGISAGFYNKSFNNNFRPRETNDPNIPTDGYSQFKPDFGIGIKYTNRYYFGGISINHLNNPKFDFGAANGQNIINRTINGIIGLNLPINSKIEIVPNLLFRSDLQTYNIEGGLLANIGSKYWLGANYRNQDAAIVVAGVSLLKENSLKLGFSYDFVTQNQYIKSASSFEIMARYVLTGKSVKTEKIPMKNPIIRTPRYRH